MTIDHSLIEQARHFITGANIHLVGTWILCYELFAMGDDPRHQIYENLLRDFARTKRLLLKTQPVPTAPPFIPQRAAVSSSINRRIQKLLTTTSD